MNKIWQDGEFTPIAQIVMFVVSLLLGLSGYLYMWIINQ
jgi:hypothetical protein